MSKATANGATSPLRYQNEASPGSFEKVVVPIATSPQPSTTTDVALGQIDLLFIS